MPDGPDRLNCMLGLGAITVAAWLVAGLLGPVAVTIYATVLSLPVWGTW